MLRLLIFCGLLTVLVSSTGRAYIRPHLDPILDPTYEWSMRSRVSEIARKIEAEHAAGRSVPAPGSIEAFVNRQYRQEESGLDSWGVPFHLVRTATGLRVACAGRDRQLHTEDDVLSPVLSVPLP